MQMHVGLAAALALAGCAPTTAETRSETSGRSAAGEGGGATTSDPQSVSSDKLEEIDMFFHRKAAQLQFSCYNPEVDNTHKKYEGNVSIGLVVMPGGKATDVKLIGSSLHSTDAAKVKAPGIEQCVLDAVKGWEWPEVNASAPYSGSINFKPAW